MIGLFPVSLAPGIRVLATSRGLRAQVGPRGTSFGAVPFTYYQPLSGGRRHGGSYYAGPTQQQIAETSDEHQVVVIDEALHAIANIHRDHARPGHGRAPTPSRSRVIPQLLAAYKRQELTGVRWSDRAGRKAAKARARELADAYAVHLQTRLSVDLAIEADQIHHRWTLLRENQPEVVLETLGAAFEEHEAPASAVGVDEAEVLLLVLVPASSVVPTLEPSNGATGDRSLRPMSAERPQPGTGRSSPGTSWSRSRTRSWSVRAFSRPGSSRCVMRVPTSTATAAPCPCWRRG